MRIISLLPSATEIICLLGLEDSLVGISHECNYPSSITNTPIVTKTAISHDLSSSEIDQQVRHALVSRNALYTLDETLIKQLNPDLLVTQSLCNVCAVDKDDVLNLALELPSKPEVINLEPSSLNDMYTTIEKVAYAADCDEIAQSIIGSMKERVNTVQQSTLQFLENSSPIRVVYLEWIDPLFNSGHWICELIELAGGLDCLGNASSPAKTIQWDDIVNSDPDVLIIGCCGYDIERSILDLPMLTSHSGWEKLRCVKSRRVFLVDGNSYFSRPSPRLIDSLEILNHMLHSQPQFHPLYLTL